MAYECAERDFSDFRPDRNSIVVVVLHRDPKDSPLAEVLQNYTAIPIREPDDSPGRLRKGWSRWLDRIPPSARQYPNTRVRTPDPGLPLRERHWCADPPDSGPARRVLPSLAERNLLQRSRTLVNPVTVVLLSCANDDGARGCEMVKASGEEWCSRIRPRARRPPRSTRRCARCNRTSLPIRPGDRYVAVAGTPLRA